jgi:hypothetical protein
MRKSHNRRRDRAAQDDRSRRLRSQISKSRRLPPRPKPNAEEERHRRLIRVRPIIIRSVVVISAVIGMVGVMPIVSDSTPRAEVGCLRCVSCVQACCVQANLRIGRGCAPGRSRSGQHQPRCHHGRSNPSLHGSVPFCRIDHHATTGPRPRACLDFTHAH